MHIKKSGSGLHTQSASVTIVFDNADQRLPLDMTEVSVRRSIGVKKDEYYLNNRHVTSEEIHSLLETAGLSRSNPYNVVLQGQVRALVGMSPKDRLNLLKEVAGARVYDDRRSETLKILSEADSKRTKIVQILEMLSKRLLDLQVEKDELVQYQIQDRRKRAIEYVMKDCELRTIESTLVELDNRRTDMANRIGESRAKIERTDLDLERANVESRRCAIQIDQSESLLVELGLEWKRLEEGRLIGESRLVQDSNTNDALESMELQHMMCEDGRSYGALSVEERLLCLQKWIAESERVLSGAERRYEELELQESELDRQMMVVEVEGNVGAVFCDPSIKSPDQFERYRAEKLNQVQCELETHERNWSLLGDEISMLEIKHRDMSSMIEEERVEYERHCADLERLAQALQEHEQRRDAQIDARKELWRREALLVAQQGNLKDDYASVDRELSLSMSSDVSNGLKFVNEATRRLKLEKNVYGPLIDLMDVDEEYYTCVEVAAGNKLFNIVVDTDQTASVLLKSLSRENVMGRVTLMPLNRLTYRRHDAVEESSELATRLLSRIRYDGKFEKAFEQVMGKVFVCANLDMAFDVAHMGACTCVTLDGDRVSGRGAVKGGYYERRHGRLYLNSVVKRLREELRKVDEELRLVRDELIVADQAVDGAARAVGEARKQYISSRDSYERYMVSMKDVERQCVTTRSLLQKKRELQSRERLAADSAKLRASQIESAVYGQEASSSMTLLSVNDQQDRIELLRGEKAQLECEKAKLEKTLLMFYDERSRIKSSMGAIAVGGGKVKREVLEELERRMSACESELSEARAVLGDICEQIEKLRVEKQQLESSTNALESELEQILNSKFNWIHKRNQVKKRVYEIGVISSEEQERCSKAEYAELVEELKSVKRALSCFSKVNRKAIDQYVLFEQEKAKFEARLESMNRENDSIRHLISKLDMQKDEAITRTFRGVSMAFKKIFAKLTDGCSGDLVMQQQHASSLSVDSYVGVNMAVSFEKNSDKFESISQLSGGQQSLVALSLIFAIQKNDPAPFYVFDEIDPALDNQHRKMVAKMFVEASHGYTESQLDPTTSTTQFIATTHSPELVNISDQTLLISFNNKISLIENVSKSSALETVKLDSTFTTADT